MSASASQDVSDLDLPLLTQKNTQTGVSSKPSAISASSLLASSKVAKSSANPYRTLSAPIDRIIGSLLRPGFGLQISGPPGTYVEQLLIGLIKSVTSDGKEVFVIDMQNRLKADIICQALKNDEGADKVYYHMLHKLDEIVSLLTTLQNFLSTHPQVSLLVLSCLSFPFQVESNFATKNTTTARVRELIVKLCKQNDLVAVITSTMSTQFSNHDGSRGTFDNDSTGVMTPQIDLSCKSISSLIISRDDRKSGRAVLIPATNQQKLRTEFSYVGLELRDKIP